MQSFDCKSDLLELILHCCGNHWKDPVLGKNGLVVATWPNAWCQFRLTAAAAIARGDADVRVPANWVCPAGVDATTTGTTGDTEPERQEEAATAGEGDADREEGTGAEEAAGTMAGSRAPSSATIAGARPRIINSCCRFNSCCWRAAAAIAAAPGLGTIGTAAPVPGSSGTAGTGTGCA